MSDDTGAVQAGFPDISRPVIVLGHEFMVEPGDIESIERAHALAAKLDTFSLTTIEPGVYRALADELMDTIDELVQQPGASREVLFAGRRINIIHLTRALGQAIGAVTAGFAPAVAAVVSDLTDTVPEE